MWAIWIKYVPVLKSLTVRHIPADRCAYGYVYVTTVFAKHTRMSLWVNASAAVVWLKVNGHLILREFKTDETADAATHTGIKSRMTKRVREISYGAEVASASRMRDQTRTEDWEAEGRIGRSARVNSGSYKLPVILSLLILCDGNLASCRSQLPVVHLASCHLKFPTLPWQNRHQNLKQSMDRTHFRLFFIFDLAK